MTEQIKRVSAPEVIDNNTGQDLYEQAYRQKVERDETLVLDLNKTRKIESQGGAWIVAIAHHAGGRGGAFKTEGQHDDVAEFIGMIEPGFRVEPPKAIVEEGFFEGVGGRALKHLAEVKEFLGLLLDTIYWTILAPFEGRGFRWGLWTDEIYEMGVRAVRINVLMNFLLGLIIAMLSAAQIAKFGLGIYVADLLTIAFARELAAIMTAVVVSARTGAAIAAELSTMTVQEEIDALRSMGLNVTQFLVSPKVLSLLVVMPCLVALGMIAGVLGGSLWGILVLDIRPDVWFNETLNAASMSDVAQGMLKAVTFAIMIVLVGCHNGFRVKGGSRGVGLMTTRAVVMDIFFIILIDIVFAALFYYILEIDQFA